MFLGLGSCCFLAFAGNCCGCFATTSFSRAGFGRAAERSRWLSMGAGEYEEPDVHIHTPLILPIPEDGTFAEEIEGKCSEYGTTSLFDSSPSLRRGQHRRSPEGSIFAFGSVLLDELRGEFEEYVETESIALSALLDVAQQAAQSDHPPLDPKELAVATVLIVEEELDFGDLKWSLLSNTFFIFGGLYELISSVWDLDMNGEDNTNEFLSMLQPPSLFVLIKSPDTKWATAVLDCSNFVHLQ